MHPPKSLENGSWECILLFNKIMSKIMSKDYNLTSFQLVKVSHAFLKGIPIITLIHKEMYERNQKKQL